MLALYQSSIWKPLHPDFFSFFFFFLMWTIFEVLIEFFTFLLLLLLMFWVFGHEACGILAPQPGIKPAPSALEVRSLNPWTSREDPRPFDF